MILCDLINVLSCGMLVAIQDSDGRDLFRGFLIRSNIHPYMLAYVNHAFVSTHRGNPILIIVLEDE